MKRIDEKLVFSKEQLARDHRLAVMAMIQQQIDVVQGIMERHQELVKGPIHYNMCAGLIDQLKTHAVAAFTEGGSTAPSTPDGAPTTYFQFPDEKFGL